MNLVEKIEDFLGEAAGETLVKAKGTIHRNDTVLFKDTPFSFAFQKTAKGLIKGLTISPEHRDAYSIVRGRGATISYTKKELAGFIKKNY